MKKIKMILSNPFEPDVRVYKEAAYLVKRGFDVEILCWDRENEYADRREEVLDGIKIKRFYVPAVYGSGLKQFGAFREFSKVVKACLREEPADILYCHDLDGAMCGLKCRKYASSFVFDMHEFYFKKNKVLNVVMQYYLKKSQNKADYIVYVNELQKNGVSDKNLKKFLFLPNYPVKEQYEPLKKTPSDTLRVNYIGAVRQPKALKLLADAVESTQGCSSLIIGSGVASDEMKSYVKEFERVTVEGYYNGLTQSGELFSNTDILYIVYDNVKKTDGIAVKMYEAILTLTPVVVEKDDSMAEFVNERGIGFVFDKNSPTALKDLLERIKSDKKTLQKKAENMKAIQTDYDFNTVVKVLDTIL